MNTTYPQHRSALAGLTAVMLVAWLAQGCSNDAGGSGSAGSGGTTDTGSIADTAAADAGGGTDSAVSTDTATATDTAKPTDTATATDTAPTKDAGPAGCKATEFTDPTDGKCKDATCKNMSGALHGALKALVAAHNTCAADTDCEVAPTGTKCQGTCGAAINKQSLMGFKGKLADINAKVCVATGYAAKCGYSTPGCMAPNPGCVDGKCVYDKPTTGGCTKPQPANTVCKDGKWECKAGTMHLPGGGGCVEPTCKAVQDALGGELGEALNAGSACSQDSDCTTVGVGHACWGACPKAINVKSKANIEALIKVHDGICKQADYAKKCGYMTPKCMAPKPGCDGGKCVYNKP